MIVLVCDYVRHCSVLLSVPAHIANILLPELVPEPSRGDGDSPVVFNRLCSKFRFITCSSHKHSKHRAYLSQYAGGCAGQCHGKERAFQTDQMQLLVNAHPLGCQKKGLLEHPWEKTDSSGDGVTRWVQTKSGHREQL